MAFGIPEIIFLIVLGLVFLGLVGPKVLKGLRESTKEVLRFFFSFKKDFKDVKKEFKKE